MTTPYDDTSTSAASEALAELNTKACTTIQVHELSNYPDRFCEQLLSNNAIRTGIKRVDPSRLHDKHRRNDRVRLVCISDTHSRMHLMRTPIPDGDILIHTGDFTMYGRPDEVEEFSKQLSQLPHAHKILIAGNHELSFDGTKRIMYSTINGVTLEGELRKFNNVANIQKLLPNDVIYLENESCEILGYKFFGSPVQCKHLNWAFNVRRGRDILDVWNKIPDDTDILLTHGPPALHGDRAGDKHHVGCVELYHTVIDRVRPSFHIFGHVHEGYGVSRQATTTFVNCSTCTKGYQANNPAIVIDLPRKNGLQSHVQ